MKQITERFLDAEPPWDEILLIFVFNCVAICFNGDDLIFERGRWGGGDDERFEINTVYLSTPLEVKN